MDSQGRGAGDKSQWTLHPPTHEEKPQGGHGTLCPSGGSGTHSAACDGPPGSESWGDVPSKGWCKAIGWGEVQGGDSGGEGQGLRRGDKEGGKEPEEWGGRRVPGSRTPGAREEDVLRKTQWWVAWGSDPRCSALSGLGGRWWKPEPVDRGTTGDPEFGKSLQSRVCPWDSLEGGPGGTMKVCFHGEGYTLCRWEALKEGGRAGVSREAPCNPILHPSQDPVLRRVQALPTPTPGSAHLMNPLLPRGSDGLAPSDAEARPFPRCFLHFYKPPVSSSILYPSRD